MVNVKVMVSLDGLMELFIRDSLNMEWPMVKESLLIPKAIAMRVIGSIIRLMVLGNIFGSLEDTMKVDGKKISLKVMEFKIGVMAVFIKENSKTDLNKVKDIINGPITPAMRDSGMKEKFKVKVLTNIMMEEYTRVNGNNI